MYQQNGTDIQTHGYSFSFGTTSERWHNNFHCLLSFFNQMNYFLINKENKVD